MHHSYTKTGVNVIIQLGTITEKPHIVSKVNDGCTVSFNIEVVNADIDKEHADFVNQETFKILTFGKIADEALSELSVGEEVYVKGNICYQKEEGERKKITTIIAKEIVSLKDDKKKEEKTQQSELF